MLTRVDPLPALPAVEFSFISQPIARPRDGTVTDVAKCGSDSFAGAVTAGAATGTGSALSSVAYDTHVAIAAAGRVPVRSYVPAVTLAVYTAIARLPARPPLCRNISVMAVPPPEGVNVRLVGTELVDPPAVEKHVRATTAAPLPKVRLVRFIDVELGPLDAVPAFDKATGSTAAVVVREMVRVSVPIVMS